MKPHSLVFMLAIASFPGLLGAAQLEWTPVNTGTSLPLRSVATGNDFFVATGADGIVLRSTRGLIWQPIEGLQSLDGGTFRAGVNEIEFVNGEFLLLTQTGRLIRSEFGFEFEEIALDFASTGLFDVAFNADNGIYTIAFSAATTAAEVIATSFDLTDFTTRFTGTSIPFQSIARGEDEFVAVGLQGQVAVSEDGIQWQNFTLPVSGGASVDLFGVTYFDGAFIAVGTGGAYASSDGMAWAQVLELPDATLRDVAASTDAVVAVGSRVVDFNEQTVIVASSDAAAWTEDEFVAPGLLQGVAFGEGSFVAVGQNGLLVTTAATGLNIDPIWGDSSFGPDGIVITEWYGEIYYPFFPWVFNDVFGWQFATGDSKEQVLLWNQNDQWILTGASLWPFFYRFSDDTWFWFDETNGLRFNFRFGWFE